MIVVSQEVSGTHTGSSNGNLYFSSQNNLRISTRKTYSNAVVSSMKGILLRDKLATKEPLTLSPEAYK